MMLTKLSNSRVLEAAENLIIAFLNDAIIIAFLNDAITSSTLAMYSI